MLEKGNLAPDFTLEDIDGNKVSLSDFKGKKVVLYFYPKANTSGCTKEAEDFRDHYEEFQKKAVVVIGISRDKRTVNEKFSKKLGLPFIILSDPDSLVVEAYNVFVAKKMYGKEYMGIERSTFIIDEKGLIQDIWHKVKVEGHVRDVLGKL